MRQLPTTARRFVAVLLGTITLAGCQTDSPPTYKARDSRLHRRDLLLYAPATAKPAIALIFFFGNDVGFWKPHRRLAARLARAGYDVAGLDTPRFLAKLPTSEPERDAAFADSIVPLVAEVRHEFGASLPFILAGHSFGAELAFWLARNHEPPGLTGVLALSPRASGHLVITPMDWAGKEPHGRDAWSTVTAARDIDRRVRIAIVRGVKDRYAVHDSAFAVAGGSRLHRYLIPFAGHSLKGLLLTTPVVEHALSFLLHDGNASAMNAQRSL